ncbi:phage integrase-like protein [Pseudomonas putida TRO1]|uniref:Phage integrase-like protein n=1 Tax=Pseudomonas putida TRO1 TaxID=1227924 RepID=A0AAD2WA77_PSEPU|nr:site-specific integrase [Pseudomonas putida]ENY76466.1 phage integrase-like protein [Pseudomonas putida TRO1]
MPAHPAYLTLNRHGTYYFRLVVPKPLRSAFGLQREIRRSLKTDSQRLALRRARQYIARYEAIFDRILAVVEKDDYQPSDEDYELFLAQIEKAEAHTGWSTAKPSEVPTEFKSQLSDREWQEVENSQRKAAIAQALAGNPSRPVPEGSQELAEHVFTEGRPLPLRMFRKLLPELIERLALHHQNPPTPTTTQAIQQTEPDGPTLYEIWQLQWENQERLNKGRQKSARTKEDEQGHARRLNILSDNKPINQLTLTDFEQIYLSICNIRTNRGSELPPPDSPRESILARGPEDQRISSTTIEKLMIRLGVLHAFAFRKGLTGISPELPDKPKLDHNPPGAESVQKAFSKSDLQAIFSGYLYAGAEPEKSRGVYPYQFWLPLLSLHTGGRLNELCQLDTEDVSEKEGIWVISMMDDERDRPLPKVLKNQSSRRVVPIHSELIRMGFLDFVTQAVKEGREKLFSDGLTYDPKKGWGSRATHFFCRFPSPSTKASGYLYKCGIRERDAEGRTDRKNFHSFRHTFVDMARESGEEAYLVAPDITGHSRGKEGQIARYGNGFNLHKKQSVLEELIIPVDLSEITYADFVNRLGCKLKNDVQRHREEHGLNQTE